ncbi:hypothetical protein M4F84_001201 [Campylobacter coli]|nr:hypothetical protein [Campylobacter coli]
MSIQKAYIDNKQIFLINGLVDSCHWYYLELFGKSQIIQSISASVISGKAGYINIPKDKLPQKENKIESEFLSFWGEGKIKREITQLENGYAHCILHSNIITDGVFAFVSLNKNKGDDLELFRQWLMGLPIPIPNDAKLIVSLYETFLFQGLLFCFESWDKQSKLWLCKKIKDNDYNILTEAVEYFYFHKSLKKTA